MKVSKFLVIRVCCGAVSPQICIKTSYGVIGYPIASKMFHDINAKYPDVERFMNKRVRDIRERYQGIEPA